MEVLISMFVLLFGLMGVAAIFPVGNHYVVEGEKLDQGNALAQNAFEEILARGILRPELWLYAGISEFSSPTETGNPEVIQPADATFPGALPGTFNVTSVDGPGHAFVIDPIGAANTPEIHIPFEAEALTPDNNPWLNPPAGLIGIPGKLWPIRRITLPQAGGNPFTGPVAETIFRLRDDLAIEMPDQDDLPSIQRWNVDGANNLLSRQYHGNFSWLVTVVPTTGEALTALQPAAKKTYTYDVSVVVFYKRDFTPSATSERLIQAEMLGNGELAIYDNVSTNPDAAVDEAVDKIRPGDWIAVCGVNQTTGTFMLKWYRLLALDDETHPINEVTSNPPGRYAMLIGPDWPTSSYENLRAIILPGAASVTTREMVMEGDSIWGN